MKCDVPNVGLIDVSTISSNVPPAFFFVWLAMDTPPRQASDFAGPEELAKHLKGLAEDEEAYEAYFKWREDPDEEKRFNQARGVFIVIAVY